MERDSATLALLLPYSAIASVAHRFSSRDDVAANADQREASAVREAVGRVEMTVRAEVAAIDLPIEQVLALQTGDVLRLDAARRRGRDAVRRRRAGASGDARPQRGPPRGPGDRTTGRRVMTTDEALRRAGRVHRRRPSAASSRCSRRGRSRLATSPSWRPSKHPLEGIPVPAVATMVSYVDGVTGGNLFVMTIDGARKLCGGDDGRRARRRRPARPSSPSSSSRRSPRR